MLISPCRCPRRPDDVDLFSRPHTAAPTWQADRESRLRKLAQQASRTLVATACCSAHPAPCQIRPASSTTRSAVTTARSACLGGRSRARRLARHVADAAVSNHAPEAAGVALARLGVPWPSVPRRRGRTPGTIWHLAVGPRAAIVRDRVGVAAGSALAGGATRGDDGPPARRRDLDLTSGTRGAGP